MKYICIQISIIHNIIYILINNNLKKNIDKNEINILLLLNVHIYNIIYFRKKAFNIILPLIILKFTRVQSIVDPYLIIK